jgi:hypothetical protein
MPHPVSGGRPSLLRIPPHRDPGATRGLEKVRRLMKEDNLLAAVWRIFCQSLGGTYEHRNVVVEIVPSVNGPGDDLRQRHPDPPAFRRSWPKKMRGEPMGRTFHLNAHELRVWTNRETSGDGYRRLKEAFEWDYPPDAGSARHAPRRVSNMMSATGQKGSTAAMADTG